LNGIKKALEKKAAPEEAAFIIISISAD